MDGENLNDNVRPSVEVIEVSGEWLVRVVEEHQELTRSFDREWYALVFAESQRLRLGLSEVTRS